MTGAPRPRPIILVILDGFGIGHDPGADAIAAARMPVWRNLIVRWPHAILAASESAVGLPAGQMGNSEVGHLALGAGRPVPLGLPRIDAAIDDGWFFVRPAFLAACARAREGGGRLHVVGLIGPGGVHAQRPASRGAGRACCTGGRSAPPGPRPARWPRHATALGARIHA